MALAAVYDGKSVAQIRNQLLLHGYEAEIQLIDTKLCSLGVSDMVHQPGAGLTWNPDADTLALNAHRSGQTVTQIAAQLCRNGYVAPLALVKASLERQGVRIWSAWVMIPANVILVASLNWRWVGVEWASISIPDAGFRQIGKGCKLDSIGDGPKTVAS